MNKSIQKALDILELFWRGKEELSINEMAHLTNQNKATVYRIVSTLAKRGYLYQQRRKGKYSLGTAFLEYSGILKNKSEFRDIIVPYLTELTQIARESAIIAFRDRRGGVIVETFHAVSQINSPLKAIYEEGIILPLHCTCLGKILLADMTEDELTDYVTRNPLKRFTPNTIIEIEPLKKHLAKIRKKNSSYDNEEYAIGVKGVASGIMNYKGKVFSSLCIVAPSARMNPREMEKYAQTVKRFCLDITQELKYRVDIEI